MNMTLKIWRGLDQAERNAWVAVASKKECRKLVLALNKSANRQAAKAMDSPLWQARMATGKIYVEGN